jgi:hypothetical protein
MIIKRVEEASKCKIISMKTLNKEEHLEDKDIRVLYFRVVFAKP